ncbi:transcription repressor NadR [Bacillus sp. HMF5848]|uniref:transcription repressor NadR n=1 Tax=Bacillus sp. HMF5848 TaxID=2495421 RepID=UPI000F782E0C|nr:transcription repressor NadR [Bacillus sp. HMF5848]RSK25737.1 transcription repressor NadR [Bacillus sp. HMF5848]
MKDGKILGEKRRRLILEWLKESPTPLTGSDLAEKTNVSRQVIVQDISLLKAKNEPIMATSQGYVYLNRQQDKKQVERVIACCHSPETTKKELYILVDHGVMVKNVIVEHPVYGEITASIMVSNRREVDQFMSKLSETNASLLSELTDGTHLHTVVAVNENLINQACEALEAEGFLI